VKRSDGFINDKKMVKKNICFSSNLILDTMEDDSMIESHEFDDANSFMNRCPKCYAEFKPNAMKPHLARCESSILEFDLNLMMTEAIKK